MRGWYRGRFEGGGGEGTSSFVEVVEADIGGRFEV